MKLTFAKVTFCIFLISTNSYSQADSSKQFVEEEITKVKDGKGNCYYLMDDYSVLNIRSCFNSEVSTYKFYLAKFNYMDSTLHLIGEGKNINDSSRFDVFKMFVGKIIDNNYLASTYKFEKISYCVFDIIFKVKPSDFLFISMGNYSDQIDDILLYSMDSFKIGELIYGKH